MIDVSGSGLSASYEYNGLGDRVSQTVDSVTTDYTLDIASGLTQVLGDGDNTYLYGLGRVAEHTSTNTDYYLADALGSVRQLTDGSGAVSLTKSYSPFGDALSSEGQGASSYGFTGEWRDSYITDRLAGQGLIYLRSRYYAPWDGRFITRDTWTGDYQRPLSLNRWNYVESNPVNRTDPTGHCFFGLDTLVCIAIAGTLGGIAGGMAYHGYEVLTSEDPCARWDWNRALLWGGAGGIIDTTLSVGGYGAWTFGAKLGWWRTAEVVTGSNIVYQGWQQGQRYIGITKNWVTRQSYWIRQGMTIRPIPGLQNLSRTDARAVEQYLIEYYGLGNLSNKINSIATTNPLYNDAMVRAERILKTIGWLP